ncbi:mannosyl-N-acetyl-alpha-D-glucosaminyl-diphospho-ditrans,octacis-undecaprenol 3-alpha-mannosyltransferase / alpha-1,3-rhamnosyltransferase [Thermoflexales bacterium]|nr:mannosyl-N-acetyl-alpha-D-glucosaminyl-diphospho-ditrans,octacis-undecaprenol 3-alpha-mannosyltransferase / alpha-1,3-rhamnosyltransferase [Thermoflexales bacterium]
MKIALDARLVYYRRYSGIGQYIVHLAEQLPGLDVDNSYTIIHSRKDRVPPRHPAARKWAAWTPSHHRLEQIAFPWELRRLPIDLLHSPDFIPPFTGRFKRVITVHDLNFLYYPQFLTSASRRYYNTQIERAVQAADHILADSHATRLDLIKLLNVPEEKITVVWLAPNAEVYRSLDPAATVAARARLQLPDRFILFAGTLEPRKNVAGLLRAYHLLLERDPRSPDLILAGSRGWLFDETRALIDELHLSERVHWIDSPADTDLAALYQAASVFVLPSHYEGFGLTVLEAMACGAPCIISDRGSLPEIAGGAAVEIDPADIVELAEALLGVLHDDRLQQRLRHKGLARAAEFSWERCARETLAVYRRVLGTK